MKDKISIVIPVYNTAQYLPKCIESVLNQTYQNLEIIIVDDGSTDRSGEICDAYSKKDNRIKIIHKKNGGCADALNTGVRATTGKYLGFVDSDDYVENDMYEILLKAIYEHNADIAECGNFYYESKEKIIIRRLNTSTASQFDSYTALKKLIEGFLSNVYWNKLYKKDLVKDVEFPVGNIQEDVAWTYKIYASSNKIVYLDIIKYNYLVREESVMQSLAWLKKLDWFYNLNERLEFIKKNFNSLFYLAQKNFLIYTLKTYMKLEINEYLDKDRKNRNELKKYILTNFNSFYSNKLIGKKIKFLLRMFKANAKIACYFYDFY